jgi:hypothetical protein
VNRINAEGRRNTMLARLFWMILAIALCAAPVRAEPIRIAYPGVSAAGTPLWLAKEEGIFAKQEIIALRDPKIAKYNVEDLLDQRILTKIVKSG